MKFRATALALLTLALALAAGAQTREQFFRDLHVAPGEKLDNAICIVCSVRAQGSAADIIAVWGSAEIESPQEGDIIVVGGGVHIAPNVTVNSDVIAIGGPLELGAGARVSGEVKVYPGYHFPGQRRVYLRGALILLLALTLAAALLSLLFPKRRLENIAAILRARPWLSIALGIVVFGLAITGLSLAEDYTQHEELAASVILLVFTIIAVPGWVGIALQIGRKFRIAQAVPAATAGGFVIALLFLIPLAGLLLWLLFVCLACGVTLVSRFGSLPAAAGH